MVKPTPSTVALGALIRTIRERRDLTREALAEAAGVDGSFIVRLEIGERKPLPGRLGSLLDALAAGPEERLRAYRLLARARLGDDLWDHCGFPEPTPGIVVRRRALPG